MHIKVFTPFIIRLQELSPQTYPKKNPPAPCGEEDSAIMASYVRFTL